MRKGKFRERVKNRRFYPPPLSLPPSGLGRASSKEKYGTLSIFELTTISEHSCTNVFQYKQSPGRIFPGRTAARRQ